MGDDAISRGNVPGSDCLNLIGHNPATANGVKQTIWPYAGRAFVVSGATYSGGQHPALPDVPKTLWLRSTSDQDRPGGTGGRRACVCYLDGDYRRGHVEVALDGKTAVQVATNILRAQRMYVAECGSSGTLAGDLLLVDAPAGNGAIYHGIQAGRQASFCGFWTVPAGCRLMVASRNFGAAGMAAGNKAVLFVLAAKQTDEGIPINGFVAQDAAALCSGSEAKVFTPALPIHEKIDIRMTSEGDTSAFVTGVFNGWVEVL